MKQKIITDIKFLKQTSQDASPDEVADIVSDLVDSLDLNRGLGLSAIQIGIVKKVAIIRLNETKINLINAYIIEKKEPFRMKSEGCLSMPGLYIDTRRYNKIKIMNNDNIESYDGIISVAIQHELGHFQGKLITNYKWRKIR